MLAGRGSEESTGEVEVALESSRAAVSRRPHPPVPQGRSSAVPHSVSAALISFTLAGCGTAYLMDLSMGVLLCFRDLYEATRLACIFRKRVLSDTRALARSEGAQVAWRELRLPQRQCRGSAAAEGFSRRLGRRGCCCTKRLCPALVTHLSGQNLAGANCCCCCRFHS